MIIYDIEIKKAIHKKGEPKLDGIEYCKGWRDYAGMGISCLVANDYINGQYRLFMDDNIHDFLKLCKGRLVVGFNSVGFDNRIIEAMFGVNLDDQSYDILREMWIASGLKPTFGGKSHTGFSLDLTSGRNLGANKSGDGALAPIDYQEGRYGNLIDYCMRDVWLTSRLMDCIMDMGGLYSPKTKKFLEMKQIGYPGQSG